ncbi:hypothetical protein J6X90_02645 [Candidatus Saccharibacteria bacterium]|nr:hypothetical protein [Candidatus Saccharibacteria bacterium]
MKRVVSSIIIATIVLCLFPMTTFAASSASTTSKIVDGGVYTEQQLKAHNLSVGRIEWNDSLVAGWLVVTPNKDYTKYTVSIREMWPNGLPSKPSKKMKVKLEAKNNFIPIRAYAQEKGWWDCKWIIKSNTDSKLVAQAKVEYKAVRIDEKSKTLNIKQTTTLKNGKYTTTYTVNGKKYSASQLKKLFK